MKCPQCGKWNRDSLPRCFSCGAELTAPQQEPASPASQAQPGGKTLYELDERGQFSPSPDAHDELAQEMALLHRRVEHGQEQRRRLEIHSGTRRAQSRSSRYAVRYPNRTQSTLNEDDRYLEPSPREKQPVYGENDPAYNEDASFSSTYSSGGRQVSYADARPDRRRPYVKPFSLRRILKPLAVILLVLGLLAAGFVYYVLPRLQQTTPSLQDQVIINASILNDMAAHTILIPADEGAQIYIRELRKSYIVTGGYATVEVADYTWYDLNDDIDQETMDVTLTPYIRTSAGEQKLMEPITYTIDIPLSPLNLITPDTTFANVSTSPYLITFRVAQNSTVSINGEDYSSFVNTQDGLISYNATIAPVGDNYFTIKVNCQYYRSNTVVIDLFRAKQDISLELSPTLGNTSAFQLMTISGTTIPGATITVNTPYEALDTSKLATDGTFSFQAKFTTIGTNSISITAERDGYSATLVKEVYYVPYASTYTPKAWPMDATNYIDYLNNTATRVARTQIYVCIGEILEILSSNPQLAIMATADDGGRTVLLENKSSDTWVVGERYRVYADAYGVYNGMPRLVGRYTYKPLK